MALFTVNHCCAVFSAGVDAVISFEITQCRASPVTCSNINIGGVAYSIRLTSTNGAFTQGCLAATATTCPAAVVVTGTLDPYTTDSPYEYPFFLVSNSGQVVQCRAGPFPPYGDNACSGVAGAGAFPVEIAQIGDDDLAGCAATGPLTGCPAGYIGEYTSASGATTITGCIPSAECDPDDKIALYDANAKLMGCANALSACAQLFSEAYIPMRDTTTVGCMNPSSIKCPASTYTFSLYDGSGLVPVLTACEKPKASPVCTEEYPIPIVSTFAAVDGDDNPIMVSAYNSHCTLL
jgi:hypothetical protein